jgi:hypothetical protein
MKKILFILLVALIVFGAEIARADAVKLNMRPMLQKEEVRSSLERSVLRADRGETDKAKQFLGWVRTGNLKAIEGITDINLFSAKDEYGNNCFHLAKNRMTIQSLAGRIRNLDQQNYRTVISNLRNERNNSGETPLFTLIRYGDDVYGAFFLTYMGSDLQLKIQEVQSKDVGGLLSDSAARVAKEEAIALSKDNAGQTIAQAALLNKDKPGMDRVLAFFHENAEYLFL